MISSMGLKIDMVLAPDRGGIHRAEKVAKDLSVEYDYLDKLRDRVTGEISIDNKAINVKGKDIAIVDDIISTGRTIAKAVEILYKSEADNVYVVVTHGLLSNETIDILSKSSLKMLAIANTIEHNIVPPEWIKIIDLTKILCNVS